MEPDRRQFVRLCGAAVVSGILPPAPTRLSGLASPAASRPISGVQKVIIDTDPGVDDAFALFLAMRSPELQVEAITAVAGNVPLSLTLPNALRLVEIAGRSDIPVAAGVASMIQSIVLMGGSLSGGNVTPAAEFNFYVDPEAASIVFGCGIPIRMVGLDVTRKVELTQRHIEKIQAGSGPVSAAAARIGESALKMQRGANSAGHMHLHDPLAVSCLINPNILTFEDYHVAIETSGTITAGESVGWKHAPLSFSAPLQTANAAPAAPFVVNASVATDVDSEKFFELLTSRLSQEHA
jgi:inosine-uridine nucleoside N-ribohydrolase